MHANIQPYYQINHVYIITIRKPEETPIAGKVRKHCTVLNCAGINATNKRWLYPSLIFLLGEI